MICSWRATMKGRFSTWNWDCDFFPLVCFFFPPLQNKTCDWRPAVNGKDFEREVDWGWSWWDWQVVGRIRLGCEWGGQVRKGRRETVYSWLHLNVKTSFYSLYFKHRDRLLLCKAKSLDAFPEGLTAMQEYSPPSEGITSSIINSPSTT